MEDICECCSICLNSLKLAKLVLPCQHTFHIYCAVKWLLKINSCPLCREESSANPNEDIITSLKNEDNENNAYNIEDDSQDYVQGSREEIHDFLIAMGGHGLTEEIWNGFLNYCICYTDEAEVIYLDNHELTMLMATSGCTKIITPQIWHNIFAHMDWSGQEQNLHHFGEDEDVNDEGSTS